MLQRIACLLIACLAFVARATAIDYVYDINYSATNLNMWGPGTENTINYSQFLGASWDAYGEVGDIEETWIGDFGAKAWAHTSGQIGVDVNFKSTQGGVDVQSPYQVTLSRTTDFSSPGTHSLSISKVLNLGSGSVITSRFSSAEFNVGGRLGAEVSVGGEFAFFDSVSGSATLFDFDTSFPIISYNEGGNNKIKLFDLLSKDVQNGVTLPLRTGLDYGSPFAIQVGTVTVNPPHLDMNSLSSFSVTRSQETVLNVSADILGAFTSAIGLPVNPFDVIVRVGPLDWEGRLFSARTGVSLGLEQELSYDPGLHMVLRTSEEVTYHIGGSDITTKALDLTNLNQTISFTKTGTNEIDFIPEFYVTPTLTNGLDMKISQSFDAEALKMSIGRLGFDLFSLGPLWSMHQSMAQHPDVDLFQNTFSLASVPGFQVHVIGKGLTDKAPTILNVPTNQLYQAPGISGTFATTDVDGALILSNNAFYLNSVPINVSGLLQLGGGVRSTFHTPGLTTSGDGAVIVGPADNLTITGTWGDMVGTTLARGNYAIAGEFFYSGSDIVHNAANLSVGTDIGFLNNGHNALRSLASNSGTFTMNNMSLSVPNSFNNTGALKLNNFANLTTQGFANSGTVEIGHAATLNTNGDGSGTNTFTSIDSNGVLANGTYKIRGELQYTGSDITTNNANITLSGGKSDIQYYFVNNYTDGLRRLSTNNNSLTVNEGAMQTIDPFLGTSFVNSSGAVITVKGGGSITFKGNVVNDGSMLVDNYPNDLGDTKIDIDPDEDRSDYTFRNNGTLTLTNSGRMDVAGKLGNFTNIDSDNHTATLSGGTWLLGGILSYGTSARAEFIKQIDAGTVVKINGGSFYNQWYNGNGLSRLQTNHGTLEHSGDLVTQLSSNSGSIKVLTGDFEISSTLNNTGSITVNSAATFGNALGNNLDAVNPWTNIDGSGTLTGLGNFTLAGEFKYKGGLIKNLGSGVNLTLSDTGRFSANIPGSGYNFGNGLREFSEVRSGAQLHLTDGILFSTNTTAPLTIKSGGIFSTDETSVLAIASNTGAIFEGGAAITNKGAIYLNTTLDAVPEAATTLTIDGTVTLAGGGVVGMSNKSNNRIQGTGLLVNQDNLIGGSGTISVPMINRGMVQSAGTVGLTIESGVLTNSGTIESYGGIYYADLAPSDPSVYIPDLANPQVLYSPLNINNTVVTNFEGADPGLIEASGPLTLNNSQVLGGTVQVNNSGGLVMNNSHINGTVEILSGGAAIINGGTEKFEGVLNNRAGGTVQLQAGKILQFGAGFNNSGLLRLSGDSRIQLMTGSTASLENSGAIHMSVADSVAYLDAPVRNLATGNIQVDNSSGIQFAGGTLENAGKIVLSDGSLQFGGNATLSGGGTIQLGVIHESSPGVYQWIGGMGAGISGQSINNVDNTILGSGVVFTNSQSFSNGGVVQAHGGILNIFAGGFTNTGTLQADPGSSLGISAPVTNITSGTLNTGAYRLLNGEIKFNSTGFTANAANITLAGMNAFFRGPGGVDLMSNLTANSGSLTLQAGKTQTIAQAFTNNGSITLGGAGSDAGGKLTVNALTGSGTVNLADATTELSFGNSLSQDAAYSGSITGAGSVKKTGSNAQALTGSNSHSGGTDLHSGWLVLGHDQALGSGQFRIHGGSVAAAGSRTIGNSVALQGNVEFGGSNNLAFTGAWTLAGSRQLAVTNTTLTTIAGPITDNGNGYSLTKSGSGTLALAGVNTYSGGTAVTEGLLQINSDAALGAGSLLLAGGGIKYGAAFNDLRAWSPGGPGAVIDTNGFDVTYSHGGITGNTYFTKIGAGTLTLTGSHDFIGGFTSINEGTLKLGNSGTVLPDATGVVINAGTLALGAANEKIGPLLGYGGTKVNLYNGGGRTLTVNQTSETTFNGTIEGNGGVLVKEGVGTLHLTNASTYSGGTIVKAGTLEASHGAAVGSGAVRVEGGTFLVAQGVSVSNSIELVGGDYVREFGAGSSLAGAVEAVSSFSGGTPTAATLLGGQTSVAISLRSSFSLAPSVVVANDEARVSDVFSFSGTGSDLFVLQLEIGGIAADSILAWMNPATDLWVNAVAGNSGNNATAGQQGYNGSFASFQSAYGASLTSYVGAYGADVTNNTVWAVLNHNSEFAVTPEPSSCGLFVVGAVLILVRRTRRLNRHQVL